MATRVWKFTCCICVLAAVSLGLFGRGSAQAAVGEADKVTCMYPVWVGFGPVHLANELGILQG